MSIRQHIEERLTAFREWNMGRSFTSVRLVQYCGDVCTGGIDVAINDAEDQIRGCLEEGYRAEWEEKSGRLYLCISESIDGPLDWTKVFGEEHFSDIDAVLQKAGFEPPRKDDDA